MGLFTPQSEAERFVRAHVLFIHTYFTVDDHPVYCSTTDKPNSATFASGYGTTKEEAWIDVMGKVKEHLAYLGTLEGCISEIDNSSIPSKGFIGAVLRRKYKKAGRGIRL